MTLRSPLAAAQYFLRHELPALQRGLIVVFDSDHTELNRIRAAKRPVVPSAKLG
jgi:hypothetical protein